MSAALGVVFAGDYLTLFLFWEGMAFASAYLAFAKAGKRDPCRFPVSHGPYRRRPGSARRHRAYGLATGSLLFGPMGEMGIAAALILGGFMLNAAVPPLNAWLTDAYLRRPLPGRCS